MKNMIPTHKLLTRATFVLAVAGLAWLPAAGLAQEKGATKLMHWKPNHTTTGPKALAQDDTVTMSCPKCKDSRVTVVEKTGKAVHPEIRRQVLRHECPGCANTFVTKGHGKAKTTKVVHVCRQCGSKDTFCCAMKKGSGPTPGMADPDNHNR